MAAYLLVHGAWHDERCWEHVIPHLAASGHQVHALTLPGHGHKPLPPFQVSLKKYATAVCEAATQIAEPVIVVGHSMGGMVISAAAQAQPQLFKHLVYLTGYVPPLYRPVHLRHLVLGDTGTHLWNGVLVDWLRFKVHLAAEHAADLLYHDCTADQAALAQSRLCPQAGRPMIDLIWATRNGLGSVPKTYIECLQDKVISIEHQRRMQSHANFSRVMTLDSSHSPFFSQPEKTAAYLFEIARAKTDLPSQPGPLQTGEMDSAAPPATAADGTRRVAPPLASA